MGSKRLNGLALEDRIQADGDKVDVTEGGSCILSTTK